MLRHQLPAPQVGFVHISGSSGPASPAVLVKRHGCQPDMVVASGGNQPKPDRTDHTGTERSREDSQMDSSWQGKMQGENARMAIPVAGDEAVPRVSPGSPEASGSQQELAGWGVFTTGEKPV